jgi:putative endonuclease
MHPMSATRRFIPTAEWEDARQIRGLWGERVALAYLTSCGWSIEAHRFRLGRHDIDLIARRGRIVAFVEVKTRSSAAFGAAVEAVGYTKRAAIASVASLWMLRYGRPTDDYRFDVICVEESRGPEAAVEHIEDAWRLDRRRGR